jgi:hypothetical protein
MNMSLRTVSILRLVDVPCIELEFADHATEFQMYKHLGTALTETSQRIYH